MASQPGPSFFLPKLEDWVKGLAAGVVFFPAAESGTLLPARLRFVLAEFNKTKEISWACHIDENATACTSQYDLILGHDLLEALGLIINFHDQTMMWKEATIPMKDYGSLRTLQATDEYCKKILTRRTKLPREWRKY